MAYLDRVAHADLEEVRRAAGATAASARSPSAGGRGSCTPPASSTRAARRSASSSRSPARPAQDLPVPGREFGFGTLIAAQAAGDAQVLADHGRPVLRVHLEDPAAGLGRCCVRRSREPTAATRCATRRTGGCPKVAGPCGMVIFGVTGDLARKKLMPAIYDLANRGLLPPGFSLVGFARRDWADQDFAKIVHDSVKEHARTEFREEVWNQLAEGFRFVPGDFDDDQAFDHLRQTIEDLDRLRGTGGNHAFYLSIPPRFFGNVIGQLKEHGLAEDTPDTWRRVVVEKPFGSDLETAQELNAIARAGSSRRSRSSASTTTSARRRSRTSSRCASRT